MHGTVRSGAEAGPQASVPLGRAEHASMRASECVDPEV